MWCSEPPDLLSSSSWPQHFMEQNPLPPHPPPPAAALLLRSQALHAISRLSAFALAVPSAKCLPHCPCLSTTPLILQGPTRVPHFPPCSCPRAPSSCSSLRVLLALHLCLPSASWLCLLEDGPSRGGLSTLWESHKYVLAELKGFHKDNLQSIDSGHFQANGSVLLGGWRPLGGSSLPLIADSPPPPKSGRTLPLPSPQTSILSLPLSSC